jgi:predicted transcriptional regulator
MSVAVVIDAIVRQTTVLIAQLATSAQMRAPVAHIANQTFLSLTRELTRQGLAQKVIADMFGLALRSYQQKVRRLSESATDRNRTLWQAVHEYLVKREVVARVDVLKRFANDDQALVRGVLNDLVDSGLVYKTGRGAATTYRSASAEEIARSTQAHRSASLEALVWVTVYREGPISAHGVTEKLGVDGTSVEAALAALCAGGQVEAIDAAETTYQSSRCVIAQGDAAGWEAALLDHYQAMVSAMCAKLDPDRPAQRDLVGGSTYSFDVWPEHPLAERVYGLLAQHRAELSALWDEVSAFQASAPAGAATDRVTFYFGQLVKTERPHIETRASESEEEQS